MQQGGRWDHLQTLQISLILRLDKKTLAQLRLQRICFLASEEILQILWVCRHHCRPTSLWGTYGGHYCLSGENTKDSGYVCSFRLRSENCTCAFNLKSFQKESWCIKLSITHCSELSVEDRHGILAHTAEDIIQLQYIIVQWAKSTLK